MAEVSYINPLSNEGKGIIRNYGDLNQIFEKRIYYAKKDFKHNIYG